MSDKLHILILDDDAELRKVLSVLLMAEGYVTTTAATGRDALDKFKQNKPAIALIDLKLEDMSGLEVMKKIKEDSPSTECIVLTGYASQRTAIEAVNLGAYNYMKKPYDIEQLLMTIHQAAEKQRTTKELQRAKDDLEMQVEMRTCALTAANEQLTKENTERKQAQGAAVFESNLLGSLMDNSPDHIYFKDTESRFFRINKGQAECLGLSEPSEALGKTDFDFFSNEHAQQAYADEQKIMETGRPLVGVEEKETWPDGRVTWVSTTKMPLCDENGQIIGTFGVSRDTTERKQMEQKLEQTVLELKRSNDDLRQFAYVASHDLQEPLRMITSYLQLLAQRYRDKLDNEADEFIDFAVDGAKRMQGLINALLEYSRLGTRGKQLEPYDCELILAKSLRDLDKMIEENNAVVTHDRLPTVMGDEIQLEQVFRNLVTNAIRYRREGEPPQIHVGCQRENGEWLFSVRDNGVGIEPQYFERIFEIFRRLHSSAEQGGSGIGLAICKRVVERHGGRIWVESEPEKGATFYFTIPASN